MAVMLSRKYVNLVMRPARIGARRRSAEAMTGRSCLRCCARKVSTTSAAARFDDLLLQLHHSYKRTIEPALIDGQPVPVGGCGPGQRRQATAYICGPTVYDHCHLGHAMTYVRFDLFRRLLSQYCAVDLLVGMGITDIDDKILRKAAEQNSDYLTVGQKYTQSFEGDLRRLNVSSPHFYLPVTKHIEDIAAFIGRLEANRFAYLNEATGDVIFDTGACHPAYSPTASELIGSDKAVGKRSARDFVLWKRAKPGEPSWDYRSPCSGVIISGRPGWHVECSAVAMGAFGPSVDFHYGGKDLAFPHHYNEAACCHALIGHGDNVYDWCRHWLHSGHLILGDQDEKMSKSLGNVVSIEQFLQHESANVLRLICIRTHYRSDFRYSERLVEEARAFDDRLKRFTYQLQQLIDRVADGRLIAAIQDEEARQQQASAAASDGGQLLSQAIRHAESEVCAGIADDLDLNRGLTAVMELFNLFTASPSAFDLVQLVQMKLLLERWLTATGLDLYQLRATLRHKSAAATADNQHPDRDGELSSKLIEIRNKLRHLGIEQARLEKKRNRSGETGEDRQKVGDTLLQLSDELRDKLRQRGIIVEDRSVK